VAQRFTIIVAGKNTVTGPFRDRTLKLEVRLTKENDRPPDKIATTNLKMAVSVNGTYSHQNRKSIVVLRV